MDPASYPALMVARELCAAWTADVYAVGDVLVIWTSYLGLFRSTSTAKAVCAAPVMVSLEEENA